MGSEEIGDEALIEAARRGDGGSLEALFRKYRAPLEMLLLRSIPPALRAKVSVADVLQETYASVWQCLGEFDDRGAGSFRAWLLKIAKHRALDAVRRYRSAGRAVSREVAGVHAGDAAGLHSPDPTPSSLAIAEELQERLRTSMPTLPPAQREILQLVLVEGLSMTEAGRKMGRSANAAQKLYARAKDTLWRLCGLDKG